MPKAERGSIKDIGNRIKAKGLQKLRWYCQMCSKQCRDENGFKCHLTSDSHLRQMAIFRSNSSSILDSFSKEFEKVYLQTLYRRHRTSRVHANTLYQEVIQDKDHVHMNATKWTCLSDFVQYLGKTGKCKVDETERGWYVQYIERDPTILARQENYQRRVEEEQREEERVALLMAKQRKEAAVMLDKMGVGVDVQASCVNIDGDGNQKEMQPIGFALKASEKKKKASGGIKGIKKSVFGSDDNDSDGEKNDIVNINDSAEQIVARVKQETLGPNRLDVNDTAKSDRKRKRTNDTNDSQEAYPTATKSRNDKQVATSKSKSDEDGKLQDVRKKYWIRQDILVRVISKKRIRPNKDINSNASTLERTKGDKKDFYKRKGVVLDVVDKYIATVEILNSGPDMDDGGDVITVDQNDLETVIPKVGKKVTILNGRGRGLSAELVSVDEKKCRGTLKLMSVSDDVILKRVDFDDFSKAI